MKKIIFALSAGLLLCAAAILIPWKSPEKEFGVMPAPELEQHIIKKLTIEKISDTYTPVLLYRLVNKKTLFVGSGSYFMGATEGLQLLTAEHLFSKEVEQIESPIVARVLRPFDLPLGLAISKVLHKGSDLSGWDVCICSLSDKEQPVMENYAPIKGASRSYFAADSNVKLNSGKHLARVKSLVSGRWHDVIGGNPNAPKGKIIGICVNGKFYKGESGSGFVDEEGSIYTLVSVEDESLPSWPRMKENALSVYKGNLEGIATLAGPLSMRK